MRYQSAEAVLPKELIGQIQGYFHGGYLYIPKPEGYGTAALKKTDYKIELEKRNQHIYIKYLEGWTNTQLMETYHLSEPSIRRIILCQKKKMTVISQKLKVIMPKWNLKGEYLVQKYPTVWEVDHSYMVKIYDNKEQLERNIKILSQLLDCGLPVAKIVFASSGQTYVMDDGKYYLMTRKLKGSNMTNIYDLNLAWQMGAVIGQLHVAFQKCESKISFWDNSLLNEMKGWIPENLIKNQWYLISENEYLETLHVLEAGYGCLPKQLIHRDVHFGNFLFSDGKFSGYIDFDLSQRNIRIFDLCYFLTGLLTEESGLYLHDEVWLQIVKHVVGGYESAQKLLMCEKNILPCVMKCIEILFVAYFVSIDDLRCAKDAATVFHHIQEHEQEIMQVVHNSDKELG